MSFCPRPPAGSGSRGVQEQRERWDRKRSRTSRELVQSEQDYCQRLQLVCTFFVEILKAKGTLKQGVREAVFSCIAAILAASRSLLVHLENGFFGTGLDQFCSQLHLYNAYVDNFYHATTVLQTQLKKSRAFRRFKKLQESRPELSGHSLEELLQLPVQRIQQYQRLLEDLAANSRPDDSQFLQISGALSAVTEVWHRFQDNRRRHENQLQLRRVQKLLTGKQSKVLAAGRWFIREGWLQVVPQKGAESRRRMFFLFSDMLLQARRCGPLHPSHPDRLRGEQAFPLRDCVLDRVFGHTRGPGGLLSLSFPKAQLLLMSSDPQDLRDWQDKLEAAIRKLQSRQTEVTRRDDLSRGPLTPAPDNHNQPSSRQDRKRTAVSPQVSAESSEHAQKACSAPKRTKPCDAAQQSSPEGGSSSCVLL